jgi:hypothetical protein
MGSIRWHRSTQWHRSATTTFSGGRRLPKTGIFQISAGDYRRFRSGRRVMPPTCRHRRTDAIALGNPQRQFRDRKPRFRRVIAKSSMSFEPDRRKSRKSTFLHLQVSQTLSKTRVSRRLFSVVSPSITRRSNAIAFTACSALLLFHGTSSKSRKVTSYYDFFASDRRACLQLDRHHRRRYLYRIDQ